MLVKMLFTAVRMSPSCRTLLSLLEISCQLITQSILQEILHMRHLMWHVQEWSLFICQAFSHNSSSSAVPQTLRKWGVYWQYGDRASWEGTGRFWVLPVTADVDDQSESCARQSVMNEGTRELSGCCLWAEPVFTASDSSCRSSGGKVRKCSARWWRDVCRIEWAFLDGCWAHVHMNVTLKLFYCCYGDEISLMHRCRLHTVYINSREIFLFQVHGFCYFGLPHENFEIFCPL